MIINQQVSGAFFNPTKGIYKITNTVTGRVYVGQSRRVQSRLSSHFGDLADGKHISKSMQADWTEYGPDSFAIEVSEYVDGQSNRLLREAEIIADAIAAGVEVYNTAVTLPEVVKSNLETRKARQDAKERAAAEKKRVLDAKIAARANEHDETEAGSHKSSRRAARRKNDLLGNREVFERKSGTPLERPEQRLRFSEADLRPGQEGVNGTAGTERPPAASVDENGQSGEGDKDAYRPLSIRDDRYIGRKEDRLIDDWQYFCDGVSVHGKPSFCSNAGCGDHLKIDYTDVHNMAYAIKKYVRPDLVKQLITSLRGRGVTFYWFDGGDIPYEEFSKIEYDVLLKAMKSGKALSEYLEEKCKAETK